VLVGTKEEDFVRELQKATVPLVLVDPRSTIPGCSQVLIDNENGAFLATQHLIGNGHRRIGVISGDLSISSFMQRLNGYKKALKYYGIPVREELVMAGGFEAGYKWTKALLQSRERPTAIFSTYDVNAIYGYQAVHELGLKIPDDISFVGFDDIWPAKTTIPPLTTIRVYKEELGSVAVRTLRELIHGKLEHPLTTVIPVRLIERSSVRNIREIRPEEPLAEEALS
jgi:DNA-binding LacI/PurR family transcriptional regulator